MAAFFRLKRYIKPTIEVQLLFEGFIRKIQEKLNKQIIPEAIMEICLIFYYNSKLLMTVSIDSQSKKATFRIADIHSDKENKVIFSKYIKTHQNKMHLKSNCLTTQFKSFPSHLSTFNGSRSFPIVIFNCGEWNAYIIDLNSWEIHIWDLPNLYCESTASSFIPKYQSLMVCGYNKQVHSLCFKNNDTLKWCELEPMNTSRVNASSVRIGNDKLMVIGGETNKNEIYDIDKNEWKDLALSNITWSSACAVYNDINDEVYVGGKRGNGQIEHFDFHKNKWDINSVIRNTYYRANCESFNLWLEDNKILYMANVPYRFDPNYRYGGYCQYIDLRICKGWENIYERDMVQDLFRNWTRNPVDMCLWGI